MWPHAAVQQEEHHHAARQGASSFASANTKAHVVDIERNDLIRHHAARILIVEGTRQRFIWDCILGQIAAH
jgi:hypothetical protein